jgi:hypothetical protein
MNDMGRSYLDVVDGQPAHLSTEGGRARLDSRQKRDQILYADGQRTRVNRVADLTHVTAATYERRSGPGTETGGPGTRSDANGFVAASSVQHRLDAHTARRGLQTRISRRSATQTGTRAREVASERGLIRPDSETRSPGRSSRALDAKSPTAAKTALVNLNKRADIHDAAMCDQVQGGRYDNANCERRGVPTDRVPKALRASGAPGTLARIHGAARRIREDRYQALVQFKSSTRSSELDEALPDSDGTLPP